MFFFNFEIWENFSLFIPQIGLFVVRRGDRQLGYKKDKKLFVFKYNWWFGKYNFIFKAEMFESSLIVIAIVKGIFFFTADLLN